MDIQQQKFYKILLIGETCVDQYIYGTCGRLSPEAAVPVLDIEQIEDEVIPFIEVRKSFKLSKKDTNEIKAKFEDVKTILPIPQSL